MTTWKSARQTLRASLIWLVALGFFILLFVISPWSPSGPLKIFTKETSNSTSPDFRSQSPGGVDVQVATARTAEFPVTLQALGTVKAYNTVNVKSQLDGQILKVAFEEGTQVKEGSTLFLIDPKPYVAELQQQEAAKEKDQAQLAGAIVDLKRYKAMVSTNLVTKQQLDQQEALVAQYRAQVGVDSALEEYAQTQVGYTTIKAPITGTIGIRLVDVGNFVHVNDSTTLAVINQLQPISILISVSSADLHSSELLLGKTHLAVTARNATTNAELDVGTVDLTDNHVDEASGTIRLKANFPNSHLTLWPGDFVNCEIQLRSIPETITIPEAAVRQGPAGNFVWLVRSDLTAHLQPVHLGHTSDNRVEVESGVDWGQQVVVSGFFRLNENESVHILKPQPIDKDMKVP